MLSVILYNSNNSDWERKIPHTIALTHIEREKKALPKLVMPALAFAKWPNKHFITFTESFLGHYAWFLAIDMYHVRAVISIVSVCVCVCTARCRLRMAFPHKCPLLLRFPHIRSCIQFFFFFSIYYVSIYIWFYCCYCAFTYRLTHTHTRTYEY